jgi:hypothetical protein
VIRERIVSSLVRVDRSSRVAVWPGSLPSLAAVLTFCRVPYAAIGGVAVARWDALRVPADLDVVLGECGGDRLLRALQAIERLWGIERSPSLVADDIAAGMEAEIISPAGRLDVIGHGLDGVARAEVVARRHWWVVGGRPIAVCRLDHLLAVKRSTARSADLADCARLEAISRQTGV